MPLKINVCSVMVDDQAKALAFYTDVLGFQKKVDVDLGGPRWLTVVSQSEPEGVQLLLEPLGFPPAAVYQKALFEAGIPATSFAVEDCEGEYDRLIKRGVRFRGAPQRQGPVTICVLEDTCGNLIQLAQMHG